MQTPFQMGSLLRQFAFSRNPLTSCLLLSLGISITNCDFHTLLSTAQSPFLLGHHHAPLVVAIMVVFTFLSNNIFVLWFSPLPLPNTLIQLHFLAFALLQFIILHFRCESMISKRVYTKLVLSTFSYEISTQNLHQILVSPPIDHVPHYLPALFSFKYGLSNPRWFMLPMFIKIHYHIQFPTMSLSKSPFNPRLRFHLHPPKSFNFPQIISVSSMSHMSIHPQISVNLHLVQIIVDLRMVLFASMFNV